MGEGEERPRWRNSLINVRDGRGLQERKAVPGIWELAWY